MIIHLIKSKLIVYGRNDVHVEFQEQTIPTCTDEFHVGNLVGSDPAVDQIVIKMHVISYIAVYNFTLTYVVMIKCIQMANKYSMHYISDYIIRFHLSI